MIFSLVKKYCPRGLLGLALTGLLASFMSGMAGNVTAFNTIWTYDLYQAYFAPNKSDEHYAWMGRFITVAGILLSIACAYVAKRYDNIMDFIQLVFSFVNAPLFATFLLGMFWKRCTATGAFLGLFGGIGTSVLVYGLTVAEGKGRLDGNSLCSPSTPRWPKTSGSPLSPSRPASFSPRASPWPPPAPRRMRNSKGWSIR